MSAEDGPRTQGEIFEGIAFQFCKVATAALIAGRWVLPVSAGLCAAFFVAAFCRGKHDTRCFLKHPLLAAAIFGLVCAGSLWWQLSRSAEFIPQTVRGIHSAIPASRSAQ